MKISTYSNNGLIAPYLGVRRLLGIQKPIRYMGQETNAILKDPAKCQLHIALAFPDVYEIGMSHLGLKILYSIVNAQSELYAERVFAPWPDMEKVLRDQKLPLTTIETGTPLGQLDAVGFSLQYELCSTTVLQMLDLGGIPLRSRDRSEANPLIIAGGPVALNPAPMSPFIDVFVIGEGEEILLEIAREHIRWKRSGRSRETLLRMLQNLSGVYVPSLYEPGSKIKKRIVSDLDKASFPTKITVPFCETIHDRIGIEIARGCTRGCRFCQAGMIYRPVRERSTSNIVDLVKTSLMETGYEEVALLSLSSGDYSYISYLIETLNLELAPLKVAMSLPSLRTDTFDKRMAEEIRKVRKTGFTLAPEAGTERLRRIINKGNREEDLEKALAHAFEYGWQSVKLYFMIGLPTETDEDLEGIARLAKRAARLAGNRKITVSVSSFVPKAHTPFQWAEQISISEIKRRQDFLRRSLQKGRVNIKFHSPEMSFLEGLLARGDEKMANVIQTAYHKGARFDGWDDHLRLSLWLEAIAEHKLNPETYMRSRELDGTLAWDLVDVGVCRTFLSEEWKKALREEGTGDCRFGTCQGCGVCDFQSVYPRLAQPNSKDLQTPLYCFQEIEHGLPRRFLLKYVKKGLMTLLGHHDLERTFHRLFRRLGLRLSYSKGFHPHPRMRFSPPIGMGIESECEFVDFDLLGYEDEPVSLLETLKSAMHKDLSPVSVEETPLNEPAVSAKIHFITYEIDIKGIINTDALQKGVKEFHESDTFVMCDVRKGKPRSRDLKLWLTSLECAPNGLTMVVKATPAGSVNPREAARIILKLTPSEALSLKIKKTKVNFENCLGG